MYAVPHAVTITDRAAAEVGVGAVVAQAQGLPGFVADYWVSRSADQGLALIVFASRGSRQNFAEFLKSVPDAPGVTLDRESIAVDEVIAHT